MNKDQMQNMRVVKNLYSAAPAASIRVRVKMARMTIGTNCPIIKVVFIWSQQ